MDDARELREAADVGRDLGDSIIGKREGAQLFERAVREKEESGFLPLPSETLG